MKANYFGLFLLAPAMFGSAPLRGAERLIGVQSARVVLQSMPWIAEESGIFRKYNVDFSLVRIDFAPLAGARGMMAGVWLSCRCEHQV